MIVVAIVVGAVVIYVMVGAPAAPACGCAL